MAFLDVNDIFSIRSDNHRRPALSLSSTSSSSHSGGWSLFGDDNNFFGFGNLLISDDCDRSLTNSSFKSETSSTMTTSSDTSTGTPVVKTANNGGNGNNSNGGKTFPGQSRKAKARPATTHNNPYAVHITSKEDFAASQPWTFREVNKKKAEQKPMMCNFCKNNREMRDIYLTHHLYDPVTRVLACPVLRKHICEICGGTGDNAHTLQYCHVNKQRGVQQGNIVKMLLKMSVTNSAGRLRKN